MNCDLSGVQKSYCKAEQCSFLELLFYFPEDFLN